MKTLPNRSFAATAARAPWWIGAVWIVLLSLAFAAHGTAPASASHSDGGSPRLHQAYIHWGDGSGSTNGYYDEDYCIQSHTSAISYDTAVAQFRDTFYNIAPTWDGTGGWRIDLWRTPNACNAYSNKDWIDIEVHISQSYATQCGGNYSCVKHYTAYWDSTYNHSHYAWEWVLLDSDHFGSIGSTMSRRLINHEFGHVFGLRDGDPNNPNCSPTSLMHNLWYSCEYSDWRPTTADFNSVVNVMNGGY